MQNVTINTEILSEQLWRNAEASQVYIYLLANADENIEYAVSLKVIAEDTSLSIRRVRTALTYLENANAVTRKPTQKATRKPTHLTYCLSECFATLVTRKPTQKATRKPTREIDKPKRAKFTPPTIEEVTEYVRDKFYHFDPEQFVAFYQSKGWKVGSDTMKDWKAATTTWEKRWIEKYGYKYFYEVQIQPTNGTIQDSRAQSRQRLRAVATEIVAGSQALFDLYNDKE